MAYNLYSLPDCRTVLYHPDAGTANRHRRDDAESPGPGFRPDRDEPDLYAPGHNDFGAVTGRRPDL